MADDLISHLKKYASEKPKERRADPPEIKTRIPSPQIPNSGQNSTPSAVIAVAGNHTTSTSQGVQQYLPEEKKPAAVTAASNEQAKKKIGFGSVTLYEQNDNADYTKLVPILQETLSVDDYEEKPENFIKHSAKPHPINKDKTQDKKNSFSNKTKKMTARKEEEEEEGSFSTNNDPKAYINIDNLGEKKLHQVLTPETHFRLNNPGYLISLEQKSDHLTRLTSDYTTPLRKILQTETTETQTPSAQWEYDSKDFQPKIPPKKNKLVNKFTNLFKKKETGYQG
jgi:hypothetical protein